MVELSNYETECVASYIENNVNYYTIINQTIDSLIPYWDVRDVTSILSNSLRDICEYDFTESAKEASSLARTLLFNSLGCINFNELATMFVNHYLSNTSTTDSDSIIAY